MKKISIKTVSLFVFLAMLPGIWNPFLTAEPYQGATSYTNAKEFYNSTALKGEPYHAEIVYGKIYYATCAKLASSSSNLKYHTLGFDITLRGNNHSVSFAIQRTGGSMVEINSVESEGYQYILYAVETDTLYTLAQAVDASSAAYVLSASKIHVKMDAIMTSKQGTTLHGSITENGTGGLIETGTIYHLNNATDLASIKDIFTGHTFENYKNINADLDNHLLKIRYNVEGTEPLANNSSTFATVNDDFAVSDRYLTYKNSIYTTDSRILQPITLINPADISLSKTGYHLEAGREWVTADHRIFTHSTSYMPKTIDPENRYKDHGITMYANWIPNSYTIQYDSNGGIGFTANSIHNFDQSKELRINRCIREGYTLVPGAEWNTKPDGSGTSYASGEVATNLSSEHNETITLYANWQEGVYEISTNKDKGSGGTDSFYEKYKTGWYSDAEITQTTESILIPSKTGYSFQGYYEYFFGLGKQIIDNNGNILIEPNIYIKNTSIYASYQPKQYTITFDKEDGIGGSDYVTATYNKTLPFATAPTKKGFTFKGYYTQTNGAGISYYNEYMASDKRYQTDKNLTLFAYWEDTTPPIAIIDAPIEWSNSPFGIEIIAEGIDDGSGLDYIELYCDNSLVLKKDHLEGADTYSLTYHHKTEGVFQYKLLVYDKVGNCTKAYTTVRYDCTAPTGEYIVENYDYMNFSIIVHATDYKIQ